VTRGPLLVLLAALALGSAAPASAAVRTFPGCGATLAACMGAAPNGATIRLRTNKLIPVPDLLEIHKGLTLEAAPGFKPRIGRTGTLAGLDFTVAGGRTTIVIRGIGFRQVSLAIEIGGSKSGHRIVVAGNRFENSAGSALEVLLADTARGSVTVTGNDIVADAGMEIGVRGGPLSILGNRITAPSVATGQVGLSAQSSGTGTVRGTIASNLVHDTAGCSCGNPAGIAVFARDTTTFDLRLLNNTIADSGIDGSAQAYGIALTSGSSEPDSHIKAALYNNVVSNVFDKSIWSWEERVEVTGDMNDTIGSAQGDLFALTDTLNTLLHVAPGFAAPGSYRLGPGSPLANVGRTCIARMPLPRADAGGRFRVSGGQVDVGAYERGSKVKGTVKGVNRSGTNGANKVRGTAGRDLLCGLGGNDSLFGRGGTDFLIGGLGKDRAFGGAGNDRIDVKDGVPGNDRADGGPGNDVCRTDANDRRASC
jgi:hypothetical protein